MTLRAGRRVHRSRRCRRRYRRPHPVRCPPSFWSTIIRSSSPVCVLIDGHRAYRVVGEAGSAESACLIAAREKPDFIIADIVLGGRDGAELVEDLLVVSPQSLILSYSSLDDAHATSVIRAGARGYVCKADGLQQVADARLPCPRRDLGKSPRRTCVA